MQHLLNAIEGDRQWEFPGLLQSAARDVDREKPGVAIDEGHWVHLPRSETGLRALRSIRTRVVSDVTINLLLQLFTAAKLKGTKHVGGVNVCFKTFFVTLDTTPHYLSVNEVSLVTSRSRGHVARVHVSSIRSWLDRRKDERNPSYSFPNRLYETRCLSSSLAAVHFLDDLMYWSHRKRPSSKKPCRRKNENNHQTLLDTAR